LTGRRRTGLEIPEGELKHKRPTILDVAKRARVAVGTVSNAINQTKGVSDAKRIRVLKAIAELGYSQNMLAHGLRRRSSTVVGLCVPYTSISYFAALVDAFEEVVSERGFEIMQVLSRQDPQKERQRIAALLRYHVGGIIILPSVDPSASFDLIAASGTPLVVIDRPTADKRFDQVTFDNRAAMLEAASRLIAFGHRSILFIVRNRNLSVTASRIDGLHAAIGPRSAEVTVKILESQHDEWSFMAHLGSELATKSRPTVIIASNSMLATWAFRALRSLGIVCPDDISLLALDEPEWADLVSPSLSVIRPPTRAIALAAWETLTRRMKGEVGAVQHIELRAEVVFRQSVGPPPKASRQSRSARSSS
jgi:LacI family transcriptional regulator